MFFNSKPSLQPATAGFWGGHGFAQTIYSPKSPISSMPTLNSRGERSLGPAPDDDDPDAYHLSVLPHETVDALLPGRGRRIIDGTLGAGGHSFRLLTQGCEVVGFDQDPEALEVAANRCAEFADRFVAIHANFSEFGGILEETGVGKVDGVLLDLGVSSHQIDTPGRGFSFQHDGPLCMRMNPDAPISAADIVNTWDEADLKRMFWEYGEERASGKIARAIVAEREKQLFETTSQLADLIEKTCPRFGRKLHPATKVFQALRIEVNDELGVLRRGLEAAVEWLNPGGRLAVITFHSLEDRIVKHFMRDRSQQLLDRPEWPEPRPNPDYALKLVSRKPIVASKEEIAANPRARSAKLRVAERIQDS